MANQPVNHQGREVFYDVNTNGFAGNTAVHYIFPPTDLYNSGGEVVEDYNAIPNDKVVNVDTAFLKLKSYRDVDEDTSYGDGMSAATNVAGAFYAVEENSYYYKYSGTNSNLTFPDLERGTNTPRIGESIKLPIASTGATFENKSLGMATTNVNRYDDLEVEGLNEGIKPTSMQATAIRLEGQKVEDVTYRCFDAITVAASTTIANTKNITTQVIGHFAGIDADLINEADNLYVNEDSLYTAASYVSALEIVNIERELDDLRYGDSEDNIPFIFTGTSYSLSASEVTNNTPIDNIDVWGGDSYIGLHTFKVTDSNYSLTDQEKLIDNSGTSDALNIKTKKWGHYFNKYAAGSTTVADTSRPFPLKGAAQTITVLLESEINPEVAEKNSHNDYSYDVSLTTSTTNLPVPIVDDAGQIRSNFKYYYNLNYITQNNNKVFFPYQTYDKNLSLFGARVMYSDQKIYNSDIEGFDIFRVGNIYDLDESNGSLMKLQEANDNMFALQESALLHIPIKAQIIETTDGSNLTVRSGEIIGIPNKINTLYGTQSPKTVKTNGGVIFFIDKLRGEPCFYDGKQVQLLSRLGMEAYFNGELNTIASNDAINGIYDNKKKEYSAYFRENEAAVFNLELGAWTSRLPETASESTLGGVRVGDTMMLLGIGADHNLNAASLYDTTSAIGRWWNTTFTPSFTFIVNPDQELVKTFDAFTIIMDRIPSPKTFDIITDDGTVLMADLSTQTPQYQEGSYRFKNVRVTHEDGSVASAATIGRRLKAVYGEMKIELITSEQSGTTSVITKYRPSYRAI